ncbi:hypothetical protein ACVI3U_000038 [Sinorhizobium medicae]
MCAARLDQLDHHAQDRIVTTGHQGAENARHLGQRLQCRTNIAPLRTPSHCTRKDHSIDLLGLEGVADCGKVPDCANRMVEAGPIGIGLPRQRNYERVFPLTACRLGDMMGKCTGTGNDGEPAF